MQVSVVYALPDRVWEKGVDIGDGATLQEAIIASGVLAAFPALHLEALTAGVFGKVRRLDERLHAGDRVEIYRPLQVDPKEARRIRADLRRRGGPRTPGT